METLGAIAAAVQVVDLSCRSLFATYRLVKDLKDVPAVLLLTLQDLGPFLGLMDELQSALATDDLRLRGFTVNQLDRTTKILDSTGQVCRELEQLLAPCVPPSSPPSWPRVSRAWRALVSVKTEADIIEKCERLERLKHDLNRELQNSGLSLLSSVK